MSTSYVGSNARPSAWYRLSLWEIMAATAGICFGLAVMRLSGDGWSAWFAGTIAAVAAWVAMGLVGQGVDLARARPRARAITPDALWGWRYAIAWRFAAAGLLSGHYVAWGLLQSEVLTRSLGGDWVDVPTEELLEANLYLLLFVSLAAGSNLLVRPESPAWRRHLSLGLQWLVAAALAMFIVYDSSLIFCLVHCAIIAVENSQSPTLYEFGPYLGIDRDVPARESRFALPVLIAALCAAVNLALVWRLARRWKCGVGPRCWALIALALPLSFAAYQSVNVRTDALRDLSPPMAEAVLWPPWFPLATAAVLLAVLTAAASCRVLANATARDNAAPAITGASLRGYGHTRRDVAAVLAIGMLAMYFELMIREGDLETLGHMLRVPLSYFHLALFFICIRVLLARRSKSGADRRMRLPSFTPGQFAIVWVCMLLTVACGIDALVWLGVAARFVF